MTMTAFKQLSAKEGLLMTGLDLDSARPFVEVKHYVETRKGREQGRLRRLAVRKRHNGTHFFTWKDETTGVSERVNLQEFVVAF